MTAVINREKDAKKRGIENHISIPPFFFFTKIYLQGKYCGKYS